VRLEAATEEFEHACRARAEAGDDILTSMFGRVSVIDYVRFTELHTRHHLGQMPHA